MAEREVLSPYVEQKIKEKALFYLKRGRPSDDEHTLRAVEYGKILLAKEGGNPLVVIPALYLHDVGWSRVDFSDFISFSVPEKKDAKSVLLHMKYGAELSREILESINYDQTLINKIVSIIAIHDNPGKILAMQDIDATIVFEADFLDKFGPGGKSRVSKMFGSKVQSEVMRYLHDYKSILFITRTAKELLARIEGVKNM